MTYRRRPDLSCLIHTVYELGNPAALVYLECCAFNGYMVVRIEQDGSDWHCSRGLATLPALASGWVDDRGVVRPKFLGTAVNLDRQSDVVAGGGDDYA